MLLSGRLPYGGPIPNEARGSPDAVASFVSKGNPSMKSRSGAGSDVDVERRSSAGRRHCFWGRSGAGGQPHLREHQGQLLQRATLHLAGESLGEGRQKQNALWGLVVGDATAYQVA